MRRLFLRMQFPFSFPPALCAVYGFPHKDSLCHLSLGLFRILRGMPAPIYGQFRLLTGILRLDFLSYVLILNTAVLFSF